MRLTFKAAYARLLAAAQGHDLVAKWLVSIRNDDSRLIAQCHSYELRRCIGQLSGLSGGEGGGRPLNGNVHL